MSEGPFCPGESKPDMGRRGICQHGLLDGSFIHIGAEMNKATRKRLITAANRLSLNKSSKARSDRENCCFCSQPIRVFDEYKRSGVREAHAVCVRAILTEIKL
jgi:tRNA U54 and U55 pseudouridine synthase Pus10